MNSRLTKRLVGWVGISCPKNNLCNWVHCVVIYFLFVLVSSFMLWIAASLFFVLFFFQSLSCYVHMWKWKFLRKVSLKLDLFVLWTISNCRKFFADEMSYRMDSLSVLPASFGSQDASKILSLCLSVQKSLKVMFLLDSQRLLFYSVDMLVFWLVCAVFQSSKAIILGESYIFSNGFVKVESVHLY